MGGNGFLIGMRYMFVCQKIKCGGPSNVLNASKGIGEKNNVNLQRRHNVKKDYKNLRLDTYDSNGRNLRVKRNHCGCVNLVNF